MLRHTAFTHPLGYSGDIALVKEYAGHKDVKTTMVYAHVLDSRIRMVTKGFDIKPPELPAPQPMLALPAPQESQPAAKPPRRKASATVSSG